MKKQIIVTLLALVIVNSSFGQLYNYSKNWPHQHPIAKEEIEIKLTAKPQDQFIAPLILAAIGPAVGAGIDLIKTALDKRAQSFTATYSATYTDAHQILFSDSLTPFYITITRKTASKFNDTTREVSKIVLSMVTSEDGIGLFQLKVDTINLTNSKARVTSNSKAKAIDLNIDVAINVVYLDAIKAIPNSTNDSTNQKYSYTLKSSSLGESSITVPSISPNTKNNYSDNKDNYLYSDWYQLIPPPATKWPKIFKERHVPKCWLTIKVTVKEINPYGVSAQALSDFLTNNGSDISSFLKSLIPSSNGTSTSGSGTSKQ
jgi:hypothetical protein